jgi:hypothetical protein
MKYILIILVLAGWCAGATVRYPMVRSQFVNPIFSENCESAADWTASNCSVADNTTNVRFFGTTKNSITITPSTSAMFYVTRTYAAGSRPCTTSFDNGEKYKVFVSFYSTELPADLKWLRVAIYGKEGVWRNVVLIDLANYGNYDKLDAGWYTATYAVDDASATALDLTDGIYGIRFLCTPATDKTPVIVLDSIKLMPAESTAHYAYTSDDGRVTDYLVAQYLSSKGLRGTFFIVPSNVGNVNGLYLSEAQLKQMQSWGHLIANHGYTHKYPYSGGTHSSPDAYRADVQSGAVWLYTNGFTRGSRIWAIAGGDSEIHAWTYKDSGCFRNLALLTRGTLGEVFMEPTTTNPRFDRYVACQFFGSTVASVATANALLTDAKLLYKPLIVTGWHGYYTETTGDAVIDSGGALTAEWKAHIDLVAAQKAAGKLTDITLDQLVGDVAEGTSSSGGIFGGSGIY